MKKLSKIIAVVGVVGLTIGFVYFAFFKPAEYPQLKVVAELAKTQYQVGEEISVKPYLINMGERPIGVFAHGNFLFTRVYDAYSRGVVLFYIADDIPVSVLPPFRPSILIGFILSPGESQEEVRTFTLDRPGKYKVVAWAELSFDRDFRFPVRSYARPIWIEVTDKSC